VLAQGDPIATELFQKYRSVPMPNQGLAAGQVAALVAYLESAPGAGGAVGAAGSAALPVGNPALGKELFTGTRRFANGGPPCMACHSISGIGALGGGALGPDLTPAASKFGDAGLASVLASLPFPTMSPIFASRPLASEEQAHLRAFVMQAAISERSPQAVGRLTGFAVGGAVVLLGLVHVSWRRRLTTVRRRMVEARRPARTPRPLAGR
jgi:mono/diheme cytochrome c family protein